MKEITEQMVKDNLKYLQLLAKQRPSIQAVCSEIINLQAILGLPKGTEFFFSDLHGEYLAFSHILKNASGVIRDKVDTLYQHQVSAGERADLATLIYYPEEKLEEIKRRENIDLNDWYNVTLNRLIEVCRLAASKYSRSRVRKQMPPDFAYIIDEMLHSSNAQQNKEEYYSNIISTIIDLGDADAFIIAIAKLIKTLSINRLHIIGDIYDRGPNAGEIMDLLMEQKSIDIQWGNHDILWMGAAAGSRVCVATVLNLSMKYNNIDTVEEFYGINLRPLATFAQETYGDSPCFTPKLMEGDTADPSDMAAIAKIHKAIVIIQFKLEGQVIRRNKHFRMEDRLLFDHVDFENKTVEIDGKVYPLKDCDFPTVDPKDPYKLTPEEEKLVVSLTTSFRHSERLQQHMRFLYSKGALYTVYNNNLLYHGCIPMNKDGSFTEVEMSSGKKLAGKALLDYVDSVIRQAYFAPYGSKERNLGEDFMWYLWCGKDSPLFGRNKMTTFERYLIEDQSTWKEPKNPYYDLFNEESVCRRILEEFGVNPDEGHIISGHVPVKVKDGEGPIKANGKMIMIDGGLCRAYQKTTGIAGYTLIYNSYGLRLVSHDPFESIQEAVFHNKDIHSNTDIVQMVPRRKKIADTDDGKRLQGEIDDLLMLLKAYRLGYIKEEGAV